MAPSPVEIAVERAPGRSARVRLVLPRVLEVDAVARAASELTAAMAPLAGERAVGLMFDTRPLAEAREGAMARLGELEVIAARLARVTRVARLVESEALAAEANQDAEAAGIALVVRAFTREDEAIAFLEAA